MIGNTIDSIKGIVHIKACIVKGTLILDRYALAPQNSRGYYQFY